MKNAAHPVGCVAKNGGNAPEKSTLILDFHCTMGQPYLSIAAKDSLQKPWAFGGEWSEWRGSNSRPRGPKPRVLSAELHPDIHFSAMIPRRGRKSKIFLSVVIYVVKATFMPFSTIEENPANAGVTRLCGVSPCHVPDTATALPKQARYQLRYTRLLSFYPAGRILPNQARYQLRYTRIPP